jgi:hypothetical protein
MGIEPTCQAWEARILPLNYTRIAEERVTLAMLWRNVNEDEAFLSLWT